MKIGEIGQDLKWTTQAQTEYTMMLKSDIFLFIKKRRKRKEKSKGKTGHVKERSRQNKRSTA
jgi:hypothetical protein